jgi:hypothetical protein
MGMSVDDVWRKLRRSFDRERKEFEQRLFATIEHRSGRHLALRRQNLERYLRLRRKDAIRLCEVRAERYVAICCEIWDATGLPRDSLFNRTIFERCLTPLFGEVSTFIRRQSRGLRPRPSKEQLATALSEFAEELGALRSAWKKRLGVSDEEDGMSSRIPLGGPYPSLRNVGGRLETHSRRHEKPGPRIPTTAFIEYAGKQWMEAYKRAKDEGRTVKDGELLEIARSLDSQGYGPPKDFFSKKLNKVLADFNSANPRRAIVTWEALVERGSAQKYSTRRSVRAAHIVAAAPRRERLDGLVLLNAMRSRLRYCARMLEISQNRGN